MRVHLCGVRGSMPAAGAAFQRVGGNTSCVAVAHDGETHPRLLLDGGTGLRNVAGLLEGAPFRGSLLLSHLHWDHAQGIPFFTAGDRPDARVEVRLPAVDSDGVHARDAAHALDPMMGPPFFPITAASLRGCWHFSTLDEGRLEVEGFQVLARRLPHPGGATFGLRISDGRSAMAYVPDHGPLALGPGPDGWGPYHEAVLELVDGVDLLLHDGQYRAAELGAKAGFGHSAVEYAVALARRAGVARLLLFHHDPWRTDDEVDAIVASFAGGTPSVAAAVEGETIQL
jgi:phosphoribosyl 1,2-cyclic phosphodiesterase